MLLASKRCKVLTVIAGSKKTCARSCSISIAIASNMCVLDLFIRPLPLSTPLQHAHHHKNTTKLHYISMHYMHKQEPNVTQNHKHETARYLHTILLIIFQTFMQLHTAQYRPVLKVYILISCKKLYTVKYHARSSTYL